MMRFHRKARATADNFLPATQFAVEVAEYLNANYSETKVHVFMEQFGQVGTIHWFADYEDLAALDSVRVRLLADEGYWKILEKGTGLFIDGSTYDTVMGSL